MGGIPGAALPRQVMPVQDLYVPSLFNVTVWGRVVGLAVHPVLTDAAAGVHLATDVARRRVEPAVLADGCAHRIVGPGAGRADYRAHNESGCRATHTRAHRSFAMLT